MTEDGGGVSVDEDDSGVRSADLDEGAGRFCFDAWTFCKFFAGVLRCAVRAKERAITAKKIATVRAESWNPEI